MIGNIFEYLRDVFLGAVEPKSNISDAGGTPAALYMHVSPQGLRMVEAFEGLRLKAYKDSRGIWTIGYGHTSNAPSHIAVSEGMIITPAQADAMFRADIATFELALNKDLRVIPSQQQFDAMFSLEYNIGMSGFAGSSVLRDWNAKKATSVEAADFLLWDHPAELLGRRQKEARLFETGVYPT